MSRNPRYSKPRVFPDVRVASAKRTRPPNCHRYVIFVPVELMIAIKHAAVDRDALIDELRAVCGGDELPAEVVNMRGANGFMVQVVRDHLEARLEAERQMRVEARKAREAAARLRRPSQAWRDGQSDRKGDKGEVGKGG